ncbi:MAG: hypothetical protein QOG10_4519, partial [Kribbellaceae bacterium]|nr:hypothetical protein [Kribbellaceae bacterium]
MTTTAQPPQQVTPEESWRGYAEENGDELTRATTLR